jgi:meiosis-specific serine/threonine-protein kinase MEK1
VNTGHLAIFHCYTQIIGQYVLTNHCLGSGSFATVHLGLDTTHRFYKQVACKIIKKKKDSKGEKMMKEVRILKGLNHVRLLESLLGT